MSEKILKTKNAEQTASLFGNFDSNIAQVERHSMSSFPTDLMKQAQETVS